MTATNSSRFRFGLPLVLALAASITAGAQDSKPPFDPARETTVGPLVPLDVQVVVSRYQGDKKISSMPYMLAVNANKLGQAGPALLRMGAKVPVPSVAAPTANASGAAGTTPPASFNYQDIGTNIDCTAKIVDEGFELRMSVSDTSVYTNIQDKATPTVGNIPVFRSYQSTNTLVLKDGQSREFTAATDRVSGEVIRIAVTLRVVK